MVVLCLAASCGWTSSGRAADPKSAASTSDYIAISTNDVEIPPDQLQWLVKPMTLEEVTVEANAWRDLLQRKAKEISAAEISVKRRNEGIQKTKEAASDAKKAKESEEGAREVLQKAVIEVQQAENPRTNDDVNQIANQAVTQVQEKIGTTNVSTVTNQEAIASQLDTNQVVSAEQVEAVIEAVTTKKKEEKAVLLDTLTELRTQRTALIERFNVVLNDMKAKGGETERYEKYRDAVDEVIVDVSDTSAAWTYVTGWLKSDKGGIKWGLNAIQFIAIMAFFIVLAYVMGKTVEKTTASIKTMSQLQKHFLHTSIRRLIMAVGLFVAVSVIGIAVTPLLAMITAAGLVIGLALQGTLSNFASGLLLLFYRPFDVGDAVEAGGTSGTVSSMNLMSTLIRTWDNKVMIVPNNSIWGNIITNISRTERRRVDMVFGISYSDSIDKAQAILERLASDHPKTLAEPPPVVRLHELGDSSVNFVVRPWVEPGHYWEVYWDITRQVKEEFDKEGITIPFPQRDVHVHNEIPVSAPPEVKAAAAQSKLT